MEFNKNQILTVTIEDMSNNGEGIGRYEGYILFVKDAVVKDTVRAKITKVKKNYGYAICDEILESSPYRTEPFCENHKRCGGCQIQAMDYKSQLKFKENKVRNDLVRIGGIDPKIIEEITEPIVGMDVPKRYRNKSQYPVGKDRSGKTVTGFYAKRTHSIIPCKDCGLAPSENSDILNIVLEHMKKYHIEPYDETDGTGTIRHIMIRKGFSTGEIMVCLVVKGQRTVSGQEELIERLKKIPGMKSVCVSVNNENTNVIMGNEIHTVWGSDCIKDKLLGKEFLISPLSFYQVNPLQVEKLYGLAIEYAHLTGKEEVWDICCGIGTISICMADKAKTVHGIEIVPEAIEDAKRNALANDIMNTEFICAAAEEYLPAHKEKIQANVVIVDPPRKGMDERALSAIVDVLPDRIVYVSCDSATLARDLKYLSEHGYELKKVRCVDMFPQTVHAETVVQLINQNARAEHHTEIGIDAEDYYRIKDSEI